MSNHLNSADISMLNEQIQREKQMNDDLSNRLSKSIKDLNDGNTRENELRTALSKKDKDEGNI